MARLLKELGESGEPLSAAGASWLRMEEPTNPMTITVLMRFDAPLELESLQRIVEERLLPHDRFRQRIAESHLPFRRPRWRLEPDLVLDRHLHAGSAPLDEKARPCGLASS
jgi:diacylglycerol O-acyltransferase